MMTVAASASGFGSPAKSSGRESAGSSRNPGVHPADSRGNRLPHDFRAQDDRAASVARRAATALTAIVVVAHVALLATHGHDVGVAVVLALMTLACAGCAMKVWRSADRRPLGVVVAMSLTMAITHVVLALGPLAGHHSTTTATTATAGGPVGGAVAHEIAHAVAHDPVAMLGIAVLDLVAAWVAALALRLSGTRGVADSAGSARPPRSLTTL